MVSRPCGSRDGAAGGAAELCVLVVRGGGDFMRKLRVPKPLWRGDAPSGITAAMCLCVIFCSRSALRLLGRRAQGELEPRGYCNDSRRQRFQ